MTSRHNEHDHRSMQPSQSSMDPALAVYPSYYPYQQPQQPQQQQQRQHISSSHMTLPNASSPSSQGSEALGSPPTERMYHASNVNGKRPSSSLAESNGGNTRKKARKEDDDSSQSPAAEKDEPKVKSTRGSRACTVCRRLKMKCVGAEQGPPCKRCMTGNHECIFEESNRGKRTSKKHELLTRSLRKMERTLDNVLKSIGNPDIASGYVSRSPTPDTQTATIQALIGSPSPPPSSSAPHYQLQPEQQQQQFQHQPKLKPPPGSPKLHSLPDNSLNPLGLLAEASLANRRAQSSGFYTNQSVDLPPTDGEKKLGVASDLYFKPGPMTILPLRRLYIERQIQPEMLSFVTTEEVLALFNIYFDHMNMHCGLLDKDFHTPSLVCSRSPFLLTTICSISSKFYPARPDLHARLTELAKNLAFSVPGQGYKSVEIVQAYLLLALYGCGAVERYEQDKTWLLLGMAIRMATDLNLHRKTAVTSQDTVEGRAREKEVHNRERTWILCFCLDRSASAQMGKPYSIKEDYIIRNVSSWYKLPAAIPNDATLGAYCELQRILSRSLDILYSGTSTPSGLQVDCDYLLVIKTIETQMVAWQHKWQGELNDSGTYSTYSEIIGRFYFNYSMLVVNSFGLQNAMERSAVDIGHFFIRCHSSATACATLVRDELGPGEFLKYSPDSHFVMISYAVLSLLKLVRPEFQAFLDNEQKTFAIVKDVADALDRIAANPHHTPALYSSLLRALITVRADPPPPNNGESAAAPPAESNTNGDGVIGVNYSLPSGTAGNDPLNEFRFDSEMGPVVDISTFPPTMANSTADDNFAGMLSMDSILSNNFWDSVLVPGYSNTTEGLSGGFVFGTGGSGLITPRWSHSPINSQANSPGQVSNMLSQQNMFDEQNAPLISSS